MGYINKKSLIDSLSKEDVLKIALALGCGEYRKGRKGELIFNTEICHGGDSWKLYYYHEPSGEKYSGKTFYCYTCGDSYNIIEFVLRAKRARGCNPTYYQALQIIINIVFEGRDAQFNVRKDEVNQIADWNWINKLKKAHKEKTEIPTLNAINERLLEMFSYSPHEVFLNDNISREVLELYEIGYWGKTNQIVIPHRGYNGELWGIRGRYLDECDVKSIGKYVPLFIQDIPMAHDLGKNLYGIHINQKKIRTCKKVMLVEGEKGVMQNHTYFGEDNFALAVCGNNISSDHIRLLVQYLKANEVIIAFDRMYEEPDSYAATIYYNKLILKAAALLPYCKVSLVLDRKSRIPFKASPTDVSKDILLELLDEKIPVTYQDVSRVIQENKQKN